MVIMINETNFEGTSIGRAWSPEEQGPSVIVIRDGEVYDITNKTAPTVRDIAEMDHPLSYVRQAKGKPWGRVELLLDASVGNENQRYILAPCDFQAIKACGVTFASSMVERVIEENASGDPQKARTIRDRIGRVIGNSLRNIRAGSKESEKVKQALIEEGLWSQYLEVGIGPDAEVFSKAQVLSSVGYAAQMGLHPISKWNNSEPEVVLAVNSKGKIIGATLGNDLNLRDVEGRSALLLSKAKDNNASCALGPFIRLFDDHFDLDQVRHLDLYMEVRGKEDHFIMEGFSTMKEISRDPVDLVDQTIGRHHQYPDGLMLFLGTLFAPTQDRDIKGEGFTHKEGDLVTISTPALGSLKNTISLSTKCPEWTFGSSHLMRNLFKRNLL